MYVYLYDNILRLFNYFNKSVIIVKNNKTGSELRAPVSFGRLRIKQTVFDLLVT